MLRSHGLKVRCHFIVLLACLIFPQLGAGADDPTQRVHTILKNTPLIDGHNDIPWLYKRRTDGQLSPLEFNSDLAALEPPTQTDLPRLKQGLLGGQFWSVYIPIESYPGAVGDASKVLDQIDFVHRLVGRYPKDLEIAYTASDIRRIHASGKIASLIGIEGGHAIENSLGNLRMLYQTGARYMTLTHSKGLRWVDSATDTARVDGLSQFGEEVVREMNRMGMMVDISHVSPSDMHDVLDVSVAPVIFSHSSAFSVTAHVRNIPDDVLKRLATNNGVAMITFFPSYVSDEVRLNWAARDRARKIIEEQVLEEDARQLLMDAWHRKNPAPKPTLAQVADHIDHVKNLIGVDYIGIGGDYDGMPPGPIGLEDVATYPALFVELLERGYSDADIAKIAGENLLRVMHQVESMAKVLQAAGQPSDRLIDEMDE